MKSGPRRPVHGQAGFTLIELVIVMGILAGFLVMLVQLVDTGLRMFGEGELGQQFADRTSRAQRVITTELQALRGSSTGRDRDSPGDRLLVQSLPIGLPPRPEHKATQVQVLRASIHLSAARELALLDGFLAAQIHKESPTLDDATVDAKVAEKKLVEPLRGIGNMLLVPWRQQGADDAILELRVGWFLPGQVVPNGPDRWIDPFEVAVPGSPDLPGLLVYSITMPLLQDLLHVEFLFWAQQTRSWDSRSGGESGGLGPERIWDSARAGLLVDAQSGGVFALDRGIRSLGDTTDDIQPHAILVRCVVAQPADQAAEGLLASELDADATSLILLDGGRFPGPVDGGWVKVGGEWMIYDERLGDELRGLRRGQRGTKAISHAAGVRAHVGHTVEFVVPVPHAKDDWNG